MSMDVSAVMSPKAMNLKVSGNSKGSTKTEGTSFGNLIQMSSKKPEEGKLGEIDLALIVKQLQQLISKLQLTDKPVENIKNGQASPKISELLNDLPDDIQKKIEEVLDQATTFGDLLQLVKQDPSEVNVFALAIALAGQNNQITQLEKLDAKKLTSLDILVPGNTKVLLDNQKQSTTQVSKTSVTGNGVPLNTSFKVINVPQVTEQLKSVLEVLQKGLSDTKANVTTNTKVVNQPSVLDNPAFNIKPIVGLKITGGSQTNESNKVSTEQVVGNIQFPISQQAQYTLHVTPEKVEQNRFVQELQSIIQNGKLITLKNGESQFQIKLFPDNLGRLDITIIEKHGELLAKITATTQTAKDLIESQLHQLKHAFQGQNIQLDKIEIQHQRFESPYQGQGQNPNNGREQQGKRENEQHFINEKESESENDLFSTLLNEINVAR